MWFGWRSDLSHSDSCGSGILATTEGAVGVQRFVGGRVKGNDSVQSQRLDAFTEQLSEGDGSLLCYLLKVTEWKDFLSGHRVYNLSSAVG